MLLFFYYISRIYLYINYLKYIKKWIAIAESNLNNLLTNINILRIYLFNEVVKQYKM